MNKTPKGTYGYIKKHKVLEFVKTILMIALCAATYYIGFLTTGSNKNLLTFVAILGCLPMAKFAVNAVLFIKAKGCSSETYDYLVKANVTPTFWDLYFTTYKVSYQMSALYYNKGCLIGLTDESEMATADCEAHLLDVLEKCGYKNITVKIFTDKDKFIERYNSLSELEDEKDSTFILNNILGVSI